MDFSKRVELRCRMHAHREHELASLMTVRPVKAPEPSACQYAYHHRREFPWEFVIAAVVLILVVAPLAWMFVSASTYSYSPVSNTASANQSNNTSPQSSAPKVTCSASTTTKASAFTVTSSAMIPLVAFDGSDPIKDAIQGCANNIPQDLGTGSGGSAQNNGSSSTTFQCDSEFTLVVTVSNGDDVWFNPKTSEWEVVGRLWPSKDTRDFLLWNPTNTVHGFSVGRNINLFLYHGHVTAHVPGRIVLVISGSSDKSAEALQLVYQQFSGDYHGILKLTSKPDDGPLVLQTIGTSQPYDGENEW